MQTEGFYFQGKVNKVAIFRHVLNQGYVGKVEAMTQANVLLKDVDAEGTVTLSDKDYYNALHMHKHKPDKSGKNAAKKKRAHADPRFVNPQTGRLSKQSILRHVMATCKKFTVKETLQEASKVFHANGGQGDISRADYDAAVTHARRAAASETNGHTSPRFPMPPVPTPAKQEDTSTFQELYRVKEFLTECGSLERAHALLDVVAQLAR